MKIGLFLKNFRPEIGGGSTFEAEIFQSLRAYGAERGHTFIVFSRAKGLDKEVSSSHIKFIALQQAYTELSFKERVNYKLSRSTADLFKKLHLNSQIKEENLIEKFVIKSGVDMMWYPELGTYDYPTMEIPYITTVWDLEHRNQPYFPEVSTGGRWDRREKSYGIKIQRAAVIITGTEAGKTEVERFYNVSPERIKVLPFATPSFAINAECSDEKKEILIKYNIPDNYLFYPAQFWPHKNHAGLLLALQTLQNQYDLALPLVFVGADKGNQKYIEKLVAELNLSKQVYFLGFIPQKDLIALYRYAFALTFMTFAGPDNLPPLEAFALGCPVIASTVAGAEEQMGDAALLVNAKDEKQIATAIHTLYNSQELRQTLVQRGLDRASKWTGQNYINGMFSILDDFATIRRCWSREEPFRQR